MTEQKKGGLSLPPPQDRLIEVVGRGPEPGIPGGMQMIRPNQGMPGVRPGPPGMPRGGPGGEPIQRIPHSSKPLTVAMSFAPPPGMEEVPPNGVFWMHNGGVLMSQTIGMPAIIDGVRGVDENGKVADSGEVDPGPDADRGDGVDSGGSGANEEGGVQDTTTPSEPEPA